MITILTGDEDALFAAVAAAAFDFLGLQGEACAELDVVSEERIRKANAQFRGVDRVTDVLSFPLVDEILPFTEENYPFDYDAERKAVNIGSILLCDARARAQALEYGHSERRERAFLFLHGLLHLLGYDHIDEEDCSRMRAVEESVLDSVTITR